MKVALLGYGYWGQILEKYILESDHFELSLILSRSKVGKQFTPDLEKILTNSEIKAVFIATPIETHYDYSKKCLEANKHVFCEKPLAVSWDEIDHLVSLSVMKKCILYTNYIYTESRAINMMKDRLVNRVQEDSIFFEGAIMQNGKIYKNENIYEIIGCHLIAVVHYIFPNVEFHIKEIFNSKDEWKNKSISVLKLESENISGILKFSLLSSERIRMFNVYSKESFFKFDMMKENALTIQENLDDLGGMEITEYKSDESNNLKHSVKRFADNIRYGSSNMILSSKVTRILERLIS